MCMRATKDVTKVSLKFFFLCPLKESSSAVFLLAMAKVFFQGQITKENPKEERDFFCRRGTREDMIIGIKKGEKEEKYWSGSGKEKIRQEIGKAAGVGGAAKE